MGNKKKTKTEKIRNSFSGRLIGNEKMKKTVCRAIAMLPADTSDYVTRKVWFISSPEDAWGFTFRGSDVAGQHLVFLSDELIDQNEKQITHTVLHEIGHVMLGHRNSMGGYKQSGTEISRQEEEADEFAARYEK